MCLKVIVKRSYPKRMPPKETKAPTRIAGRALPGVPGGGLRAIGILLGVIALLPTVCLYVPEVLVGLRRGRRPSA